MKKICIILTAVLLVGLFAGCANTNETVEPTTAPETNNAAKAGETLDVEMTQAIIETEAPTEEPTEVATETPVAETPAAETPVAETPATETTVAETTATETYSEISKDTSTASATETSIVLDTPSTTTDESIILLATQEPTAADYKYIYAENLGWGEIESYEFLSDGRLIKFTTKISNYGIQKHYTSATYIMSTNNVILFTNQNSIYGFNTTSINW